MGKRIKTAVALTGLATAAGLAATPSSAMASGGGCIDYIKNSWNVGVCSSDSGTRVYGDIYVNTRGSLGTSCYITFYLLKNGGGTVAQRTDGCYLGHHSAISAPMYSGCYYNQFAVVVSGTIKNSGVSPNSCKQHGTGSCSCPTTLRSNSVGRAITNDRNCRPTDTTLGVCSGDNGSRVYGDIYVNTRGSLGSKCYINIFIVNNLGNSVKSRTDGCYLGHHPALDYPLGGGYSYHTFAKVYVDGVVKVSGSSPSSY